jgi:hypothetical protein
MEQFLVIVTFLLIGVALKRIPAFSDQTGNVLTLFVLYVSLPALVLLKIPDLVFSQTALVPVCMPWAMVLISGALILLLSKITRWNRPTTGCLLLLVPLGNTSFLGIPMVKAFFGDQAIPYALLYDQLGSFLALATYGSFILAVYGTGESKPGLALVGKRILFFPPFIALALALLLRGLSYPSAVVTILDMLAATLVPVVMIAVGFQLTLKLPPKALSPLATGLAVKLVAAPTAALLLCAVAGLEGEAVQVSIFEAGMPPMVSAGALSILGNLSPALSAALVGVGIVLSFVTLPVLYQVLV